MLELTKSQEWEKRNSHLKLLNKKRYFLKKRLTDLGIIPEIYPYTKYQEEIMDMLKCDLFDELHTLVMDKKIELSISKRKYRSRKPKTDKPKKEPIDPKIAIRKQRLNKVIKSGLLPETQNDLKTEQERVIYDMVINQLDIHIMDIIYTYINDANLQTKQKYLHDKLKLKAHHPTYKKSGKHFNIKPEDIIVNEYCPFLGVKIDYRTFPRKTFVNNTHSFDRIVNSKGYVKGNVWIVSRLANTMKNEATDEQLKTFCKNVILMYARKTNTGI